MSRVRLKETVHRALRDRRHRSNRHFQRSGRHVVMVMRKVAKRQSVMVRHDATKSRVTLLIAQPEPDFIRMNPCTEYGVRLATSAYSAEARAVAANTSTCRMSPACVLAGGKPVL